MSRRGHRARDTLLVLALGTLAVIAALAWLAEHLMVLAGVALLIGAPTTSGQRSAASTTTSSQPQQARPKEPAAAAAVAAATLPLADYRDEPGDRPAASRAG